MDTKTRKRARRFLADLERNVDTWIDGRLDYYDTFTARARATWEAIRKAGPAVEERVLRALRDQLPPARASLGGRA